MNENEKSKPNAEKVGVTSTDLLAQEFDEAMSSFKMVGNMPMDHDDHFGELDGELIIFHADDTFDYVS